MSRSAAFRAMTSITAFRIPRNGCSRSSGRPDRTRSLAPAMLGTSSHHQLVLIEPNPGNPALCLSLSQPSEVTAGNADLRRRRRGHGLLPDRRWTGEWNARAARIELRQQRAAIQHRQRQLQRAGAERAAHQRAARVFRLPTPTANRWTNPRTSAKRSTLSTRRSAMRSPRSM